MEQLGRYELREEVGRGAMGTVYRAYDPKIDRVVALKTIIVGGITPEDEEEFRKRFFREAQAAGKLSHGSIVTIYDVGEDEATRTPFIVMEFIEGTTLEAVGRGERLPVATALGLMQQVAEALDYAHAHQIVHRDIKPANIILTPDGHAKITDFGIAKLQQTQFTQPGQVLGTPAYMSPEQLTGGAVDGRTDLFSLGIILYWLLTGDKPFPGETTSAVSFKIVYKEPIPPSELSLGLSRDYDAVLAHALAKDPAQRYQRGRELADDLDDLKNRRRPRSGALAAPTAEGERTVVTQPRPAEPRLSGRIGTEPLPGPPLVPATEPAATVVLPPPERRRRWLLPAGLAALALLLVGGWWWWRSSSPSPGTNEAALEQPTRTPATSSPQKQEPPPWAPARVRRSEARTSTPAGTATLRLRGEHNLDPATLYVSVDGRLVATARLSAQTVRRKGASVGSGTISESVAIGAGQHTITIRIQAPRDDFDQAQSISGSFQAGQTRTLEISMGKLGKWIGIGELTRQLTLRWAD